MRYFGCPVMESAPRLRPWNELSRATISILPLDTPLPCERIIFTAASMASVPELQKKVRCRPLILASFSASLP